MLVDVVDGADVWVIERRGGLGLSLEALQRLAVPRQRVGQKLQGDRAFEPGVLRPVNHAHPAFAKFLQDPVVTDRCPDHRWRLLVSAGLKPRPTDVSIPRVGRAEARPTDDTVGRTRPYARARGVSRKGGQQRRPVSCRHNGAPRGAGSRERHCPASFAAWPWPGQHSSPATLATAGLSGTTWC